jgi:hypothetical protein
VKPSVTASLVRLVVRWHPLAWVTAVRARLGELLVAAAVRPCQVARPGPVVFPVVVLGHLATFARLAAVVRLALVAGCPVACPVAAVVCLHPGVHVRLGELLVAFPVVVLVRLLLGGRCWLTSWWV